MRYKIEKGSMSGHGCCFLYTVVDTTRENPHPTDGVHLSLCECFERDDAEQIVEALNRAVMH